MQTTTPQGRVLVMGLGRFGGGAGVARFLAQHGAEVLITDTGDERSLRGSIEQIQPWIDAGRVSIKLGPHDPDDFRGVDLVVANPAVKKPWSNPFLCAARAAGVPITTEIRLVVERIHRANVVGITGSAGKSTTAAMIHHLLSALGLRAHLGGNIGGSLLDSITHSIRNDDLVIIELSSAMLHWLGEGVGFDDAPGFSPHVALITNITPNHLDWHGTFEHYRESKMNIARWQRPEEGDVMIHGESVQPLNRNAAGPLPGMHNRHNAAMAIAAVRAVIDVDPADAVAILRTFRGLPHRLQLVAEIDGRSFYNDSKSTTPEATMLAVDSFDDPARLHVIVGGSDKGADLTPIAALGSRIAGLYTIGVTGRRIAARQSELDHSARACQCETLDRAFDCARSRMRVGDALLLSPGCASFDQFDNFEQRGDHFCALVRRALLQS